jgi:hypothetical protein
VARQTVAVRNKKLKARLGSELGTELVWRTVANERVLGMSCVMKPRESTLRLKRFEAAEKARKVDDLEAMIREFDQMALDLDRQIASEEERTGIKDPKHFSYSTFAKAAAQRRDNLRNSISDLRAKLAIALQERDEALDSLMRAEGNEPREAVRSRRVGDASSSARAG